MHCGHCVPCIIRRASLLSLQDETTYSLPNLSGRRLAADRAEGRDIRSFQVLIERLRQDPKMADLLILKPGPIDPSARELWADVFKRGMHEVAQLLDSADTQAI